MLELTTSHSAGEWLDSLLAAEFGHPKPKRDTILEGHGWPHEKVMVANRSRRYNQFGIRGHESADELEILSLGREAADH
jgi:hypothetical protein